MPGGVFRKEIDMEIVNITVTDTQLDEIAQCSHLMAEYANSDENLLIIVINQENIQVRLKLNKNCIRHKDIV